MPRIVLSKVFGRDSAKKLATDDGKPASKKPKTSGFADPMDVGWEGGVLCVCVYVCVCMYVCVCVCVVVVVVVCVTGLGFCFHSQLQLQG